MAIEKEVKIQETAVKLDYYLVVREAFLTYQRGDQIALPEEISIVMEHGFSQHVVKVAA